MLPTARQLGQLLLIVALLISGGTHWFVLQSVAWTTMLVSRARETSFVEAVKVTFDGAHPCALCTKIETGRKGEKQPDGPTLAAKMELFYEPLSVALHPPVLERWLAGPPRTAESRTLPPPLRPPRLG